MKEIGGYFELEKFMGSEYYSDLIALNTGRNALAFLIRAKGIKKLYIPSFLCDSIYRVCEREGCQYQMYNIKEDFQPDFNIPLKNDEWIYIVNYYGQVNNELELKMKFKRIIFDNVQDFFRKPQLGIDTIYSCRKYFGVPDGAYLSTNKRLKLSEDTSKDRFEHLLGRTEFSASEYHSIFNRNEDLFYYLEPKYMSMNTHNIMRGIDYKLVINKRNKNFLFIDDKLGRVNRFKPITPFGPYMYPFYTYDGMNLKKKLAEKKIYIPTLWPTAIGYGGIAKEYSMNILPLPIDQRYSQKDMKIVVEEIQKCMSI